MKLIARIRFLPLIIFTAVLMLTVKIGDVFEGVELRKAILPVASVQAQQPEPVEPAEPEASPPAATEGGESGGEPAPEAEERAAEQEDRPEDDPTLFTQNEIDLLQQLADRREELESRFSELTVREGILRAAEQRIDRKIQELKVLQAAIDGLIKKHDEQEEAKLTSLVRIYENMKPQEAARIWQELDFEVLLLVAERMKERKLAPIMADMNPAKAKEMTEKLSTQRQLPLPGSAPDS